MLRDDIIMLRRVYGDAAATATVVRNILAPVAGLQLDTPDLHRRCVLVEISMFKEIEDVRAAFVQFGAIEAVAIQSSPLDDRSVVVFEAAAGAALALQGPEKRPIGLCKAVPSLDLAAAYSFIPAKDIKVLGRDGGAVASGSGTPEPTKEARALAFRELCERRPMIEYHDPAADSGGWIEEPAGTKRFVPTADSLVHGPTMGSDGHLWMHGILFISHVRRGTDIRCGSEVRSVSVRVKQEQVSSTKIQVTPLTPTHYVDFFYD